MIVEYGLRKNDVVVAINGQDVHGPKDFDVFLSNTWAFEKVALDVIRKGRRMKLTMLPETESSLNKESPSAKKVMPARSGRRPPDPKAADLSGPASSSRRPVQTSNQ